MSRFCGGNLSDSLEVENYGDYGSISNRQLPLLSPRKKCFRSVKARNCTLLFMSFANMSCFICLTTYISIRIADLKSITDPELPFCIILLINSAFCLFYILFGIVFEHLYYICNYATTLLLILLYTILDMAISDSSNHSLKLLRVYVLSVVALPNIILCFMACKEFSWRKFGVIGISDILQEMYYQLCYFRSLLKLDLQISLMFLMLTLKHGLCLKGSSLSIISVGILFCVLFTVFFHFTINSENRCLVKIFVLLSTLLPIYILNYIINIYIHLNTVDMLPIILYSTLITASVSVIFRCILLVELYQVYQNFGCGLQDEAFTNLIACDQNSLLSPPPK